MEDYVCTFLQQYAESAGFEERLAFLVGRNMLIDGQEVLFIGGAIYGNHVEKYEGHLRFTEKSVDYAEEMMDEHFTGMEIVGWMQSQPSYGTYLNQYYGAYHLRQFRKPYQVLFVMDPLERTNTFYAANPVAITPVDRMAEVSGYFIYYEKNTNMHDYMLANKSLEYTSKPPTMVEMKKAEYVKNDFEKEEVYSFDDSDEYEETPEEKIRRRQAAKHKRKDKTIEQKRSTNLLAGLSAVLFVVTFVMGVGLIRSQDRIDRMENEMRQLTTAFRNQFVNESNNVVTAAFAEDLPSQEIAQTDPVYYQAEPEETSTQEEVSTPTPEPTPEAAAVASVPTAPGEQTALVSPLPETYVIQPGDSLFAISLYFFGTIGMVDAILELNGLEDPDHIVAGHTIVLPQR